jgi:ribosomal protein S11
LAAFDEKNNLQAVAVAGKENVTNQLEIAPRSELAQNEIIWKSKGETQMANKKVAVFGIYSTRKAVESATNALVTAGFATSDISVLLPESLGGPKDMGDRKGYESA